MPGTEKLTTLNSFWRGPRIFKRVLNYKLPIQKLCVSKWFLNHVQFAFIRASSVIVCFFLQYKILKIRAILSGLCFESFACNVLESLRTTESTEGCCHTGTFLCPRLPFSVCSYMMQLPPPTQSGMRIRAFLNRLGELYALLTSFRTKRLLLPLDFC
jgi:hypothetical protein